MSNEQYYIGPDGMIHDTAEELPNIVSVDDKLRKAVQQFESLNKDLTRGMLRDPIAAAAAEAMGVPLQTKPSWWLRNVDGVVKSVAYRFYSSCITFLISYGVTRNTTISMTIGALDAVKVITYWGFDKIWDNSGWINKGWWTPKQGLPTPFDHLQD